MSTTLLGSASDVVRNKIAATGANLEAVVTWLLRQGKSLAGDEPVVQEPTGDDVVVSGPTGGRVDGAVGNWSVVHDVVKQATDGIRRRKALTDDAHAAQDSTEALNILVDAWRAETEAGRQPEASAKLDELRAFSTQLAKTIKDKADVQQALATRGRDQAVLGQAAGLVQSWPQGKQDAKATEASQKYAALSAKGEKSSQGVKDALDELVKAFEGLSAPEQTGAGAVLTAAKDELDRVDRVLKTVEQAVSGKGALKFAETTNSGNAGTTAEQNHKLQAMIRDQASRSNAFAKLVEDIMASSEPIAMVAGRGSCGLFDSFADSTIDMDHFGILPAAPQVEGGKKVGLTQGEILVHVLEERLYSRQKAHDHKDEYGKCTNYDHAHNKCLAPGSYQNLYRRERGLDSDTLQLTSGHLHDGRTGFQHIASDGAISTTPIGGINTPTFKPDPGKFEYDVADRDAYAAVMERFTAAFEAKLRNGAIPRKGDRLDPEKVTGATQDWLVWLSEQLGDSAAAEARLQTIVDKLDTENKDALTEAPTKQKSQTAEVAAFRRQKPDKDLDANSKYLRDLAAERAKIGPINDAEHQFVEAQKRDPKDNPPLKLSDTSRINCAITSLGAITGQKSSDVVEGLFKDAGLVQFAGKCGALQGDDVWAYLEEGGTPDVLADDADHVREQLSGDAQLRGIRKLLLAEAERRTQAGQETEVVQDGLNEHGSMRQRETLLETMAQYPDGTQFQMFVSGDMQHWIYAEKFDGKVILEDFQTSSATPGKEQDASAKLASTGMPDNPLTGLPGSFSQGMFLAVAPKEPRPEPAPSPGWPPPGSEDDKQLAAFMAKAAKAKEPAALADVLEKAALKPEWCDGATVAAAIRKLKAAYDAMAQKQSLADKPVDFAAQRRAHGEAMPDIRAGNGQIDRLLQARIVLPFRYPPVPAVELPPDDSRLVDALKDAAPEWDLQGAGLDVAQLADLYGKAKAWTPSSPDLGEDLDEALLSVCNSIRGSAIPGLKERLILAVKKLDLKAKAKTANLEKAVNAKIVDADTFVADVDRDASAMADALAAALVDPLSEMSTAFKAVSALLEELGKASDPAPFANRIDRAPKTIAALISKIPQDMKVLRTRLQAVIGPKLAQLDTFAPKQTAGVVAKLVAEVEAVFTSSINGKDKEVAAVKVALAKLKAANGEATQKDAIKVLIEEFKKGGFKMPVRSTMKLALTVPCEQLGIQVEL